MEKMVIEGGVRLKGTVHVNGAKNAALPMMVASLLAEGPSVLRNVPNLRDKEEAVDEIIERREEEPFTNVSQLGNIVALTSSEARSLRRELRLNSDRFRVTATATEFRMDAFGQMPEPTGRERTARMIMVIERRNRGQLFTLWRRTEP